MQSQRITIIIGTTCCLLFLLACNKPAVSNTLTGFDQGKKRFEITNALFHVELDNGKRGYRYESTTRYAKGSKTNLSTERTAMLNKDFSVYQSTSTHTKGDAVTTYQVSTNEDGLTMTITDPAGAERNVTLPSTEPVLVELIPMHYANDLKLPNSEKSYRVLYEVGERLVDVNVKFVGPETLYEGEKPTTSLHFKIQAVTSPSEYDDYYIDPKTKAILKIQFGQIKFVPAES